MYAFDEMRKYDFNSKENKGNLFIKHCDLYGETERQTGIMPDKTND